MLAYGTGGGCAIDINACIPVVNGIPTVALEVTLCDMRYVTTSMYHASCEI